MASSKGIETIICDHHEVEMCPDAIAVLDPIKPGCNYPFKFLSGCGVAYKFAKAISTKLDKPEVPDEYLDLVAIAAAADVVPLVGENRIFVQAGFSAIAAASSCGHKSAFRELARQPYKIDDRSGLVHDCPANKCGREIG